MDMDADADLHGAYIDLDAEADLHGAPLSPSTGLPLSPSTEAARDGAWDCDEARWEAISALEYNGPIQESVAVCDDIDVPAGHVRLSGNFRGVATTHTHQLDLAVGLDVELPSEVAAECMRQIAARSRSSSPFALRSGAQCKTPEPPPPPRSIWNSLQTFFRKDAQDARGRGRTPTAAIRDRTSSAERHIQFKIKDAAAHGFDNKLLSEDLGAARLQVSALEVDRNQLVEELHAAAEENANQAAELADLRARCSEAEASCEGCQLASEQLSRHEERTSVLEAQLRDAEGNVAELEGLLAAASAQSAALETEAVELRGECSTLRGEQGRLREHISSLEAHAAARGDSGEQASAERASASAALAAELTAARAETARTETENAELRRSFHELDATLSSKAAGLEKRLETALADSEVLRHQKQVAVADAQRSQDQLRMLTTKEAHLRQRCAQLESDARALPSPRRPTRCLIVDDQGAGACLIRSRDTAARGIGSASARLSRSVGALEGQRSCSLVMRAGHVPPVAKAPANLMYGLGSHTASAPNVSQGFRAAPVPTLWRPPPPRCAGAPSPLMTAPVVTSCASPVQSLQLPAAPALNLNGATYIGSTIHSSAGPIHTKLSVQVLGMRKIVR